MSTGKDSKTMPITKEYADGYQRTFGNRKPVRGKWVVAENGELVPAGGYQPTSGRVMVMGDSYMDGASSQDGVDIGSRKKRREYMQRRGLADTADFKETWDKARVEREKVFKGEHDIKGRREDVGQSIYELRKKMRQGED